MTFGEHHCRACGKAVCGPCSRRKINDKRACDICYLRIKFQDVDAQRIENLRTMDDHILALEGELKSTLSEIEKTKIEINAEKQRQQQQEKDSHENFLREEANTQAEKENFKKLYTISAKLKGTIEEKQSKLQEDERALAGIEKSLLSVNSDIVEHQTLLSKRNEDFQALEIQAEQFRRSELRTKAGRTVSEDTTSFLIKDSVVGNTDFRRQLNASNGGSGHYTDSVPKFVREERETVEKNQDERQGCYYCLSSGRPGN
eukprot:TRINITY_DN3356_c0_g1_i2.p1 TRINITY_DN3356_c0_g1~~TRINITY_DN3356_c0_g1_i2.p1  ORF type:complete len:259 (-),score=54.14 TRINITY_DN3356_c0_g1_i2:54-830(-)